MRRVQPFLPIAALLILLAGCRKDELFTDDPGARLEITRDTVLFDTVFTTIGTVTKRFTVRNPNTNAVRVDVALEGGTPSPFRINVDGSSGVVFNDVEILGGDSLFVFVEATLGAGGVNPPFIIEDHIRFNTNGNEQEVLLLAWGQDAHFFYPDQFIPGLPPFSYIAGGPDQNGQQTCETVHWPNDKPYVIFGYGVVDSCSKLTIDPGVKVYMHGGAGLWVYKYGQIEALGTLTDRIVFQGDRLEAEYQDLPNQWDRIWINEGDQNSRLVNCEIRNALIGLQAQTFPFSAGQPLSTSTLELENVRIENCLTACLYTENYRISAKNLLLADAGQYAAVLTGSGQYAFDHVTIANYWDRDIRQEPAFLLTNRFTDISGATQARELVASSFQNGIIYGNNSNEFKLELDESIPIGLTFFNFLFKTDQPTNTGYFPDQFTIYRNQSPGFVNPAERDLHLQNDQVFAADRGNTTSPVFQDLDGRVYGDDGLYPLGCFEPND
jgi:hypothetical protein